MELNGLKCPECGGSLNMKIEDKRFIFCPYCGSQIDTNLNYSEHTFNINKNININKVHRKVNDAAILREKAAVLKEKFSFWGSILIGAVFVISLIVLLIFADIDEKENEKKAQIAKSQGKICADSASSYEGQHYESVKKQLEAAGFTNIELVDNKDWTIFDNNEVISVSIGGDSNFSYDDYFDPDVKVIITYH